MTGKQPIYSLNALSEAVQEGKNIITPMGTYTPDQIKALSFGALEVLLSKGAHCEYPLSKLQWVD